MAWLAEEAHRTIRSDLDPDLLTTMAVDLAWRYEQAFQHLASHPGLDPVYCAREFARRRAACATEAMAFAAKLHGVPMEFRRLECNGQPKLLLKAGRVVIMQEPFNEIGEAPRASAYKRQLADLGGLVRQLELDLGDQPHRILDWSGSVLAVLLHGPSGPDFTHDNCMLGGLMLGVPDAAYAAWVLRLDLHRIAMFGDRPSDTRVEEEQAMQIDRVHVSLKKKLDRGTA